MKKHPTTILVIEEHPMMREALCNAIAEEPDLEVVRPDASLTSPLTLPFKDDLLFLPHKPDIVLLTLGNPGLDELEALKRLQELLPDTPILVLTSNEMDGQEKLALNAGADAVLTKASTRLELLQALRSLRTQTVLNHPKNGETGGQRLNSIP